MRRHTAWAVAMALGGLAFATSAAAGALEIRGTVSETTASVRINGVTAIVAADGTWRASVTLTEGVNTLTATATDVVGNVASHTIRVTYDSVAPIIRITAPADGAIIGGGGTTTEGGTTCTPTWTCGTWSTCSGGRQTRTCTDANSCGVTTGKPAESQSCGTTNPF